MAITIFLGQEAERIANLRTAKQAQRQHMESMFNQLRTCPWPAVTAEEEATFFRPIPSTLKPKPVDQWEAECAEVREHLAAAAQILLGIPRIAGHIVT